MTDQLPINVLTPKMMPGEKINPAPYNPRKIKPAVLEALKDLIRTKGFIQPLVIQKKGNTLVGGHQRLQAVKEICFSQGAPLPKLPCYVLDITDREAKELNIALNKVTGEFDAKLLSDLLTSIDREVPITHEETLSMGMSDDELVRLLKKNEVQAPKESEETAAIGASVDLRIKFKDSELRDKIKRNLDARAKREMRPTGEIIAEALGIK
jgi:ParB-like chromosome segregation protein Spo0J